MTDLKKIPWRLPAGYEDLKPFWDEFIKKLGDGTGGVTDHGSLTGLTDNDHPQYALTSAVVTDHGALTGLGDDDHPQYAGTADDEVITGYWEFHGEQLLVTNPANSASVFTWGGLSGRSALIDSVCDAGANQAFCYYSLEQGGGNSASNAPFFLFSRYNTGGDPLTVGHTVGKVVWQSITTGRVDPDDCYEIEVKHEGPAGADIAASMYFKATELGSGSVRNRVRFDADGGIVTYDNSAAQASGGSQGAGTINCKGIYVDGVSVASGSGNFDGGWLFSGDGGLITDAMTASFDCDLVTVANVYEYDCGAIA